MLFEEFQDRRMTVILDIGTERLSNSESQCHPDASHQVSVQSDLLFWKQMKFKEFQDEHYGGHFGYWNRTILATLKFHNTPMPPIKLKLNQTYRSGADVI